MMGSARDYMRAWVEVDGEWREVKDCVEIVLSVTQGVRDLWIWSADIAMLSELRSAFVERLPLRIRSGQGQIEETFTALVRAWTLRADGEWTASLLQDPYTSALEATSGRV